MEKKNIYQKDISVSDILNLKLIKKQKHHTHCIIESPNNIEVYKYIVHMSIKGKNKQLYTL